MFIEVMTGGKCCVIGGMCSSVLSSFLLFVLIVPHVESNSMYSFL